MIMTIGSYIRTRRLEKGLTIKELSNKTKISAMELWRIEQDRRKNWNLKFLVKIAKALDFQLVKMLVDSGVIGTMTDAEKNLITDPFFEKIFYELDKRKDLNKEEKKNLADILMRIIKSYSVNKE
jgi:transcriptional regulator with XRE-family HTH domain